jgi:hypothetical protein
LRQKGNTVNHHPKAMAVMHTVRTSTCAHPLPSWGCCKCLAAKQQPTAFDAVNAARQLRANAV